ncbi:MAG: hypothetical protein EOO57_21180 [Hymenobacter sp.]|nr:MAG: hypothetical protein EOO57_21180 [Hymenobacter sp.]
MKTYILSVPDDTTDPAVHAALADLVRQQLVTLDSAPASLFEPLSEEAFAAELNQALASPMLTASQARQYLGL